MLEQSLHPNSQTLLSAWQRMMTADGDIHSGPTTHEHPDLLSRLFVIQRAGDEDWVFRTAGQELQACLGRELADHNFLGFWAGHDRQMLSLLLKSVTQERLPGILRGRGESLTGQRIDIELTLAPLADSPHMEGGARVLGLYQTLGGEVMQRRRPVWRHRITAVFPPDTKPDEPRVKLVASND